MKKGSRTFRRFRRMFSMRRKEVAEDETLRPGYASFTTTEDDKDNTRKLATLSPFLLTPEEIMAEIHGKPITGSSSYYHDLMGLQFLMEVGGNHAQGWVLDFGNPSAAVVSTYDVIPEKMGPPPTWVVAESSSAQQSTPPWIRYQDRQVFSDTEQGKMTEMKAYIVGKIRFAGDVSKWDVLAPLWLEAKKRVKQKKVATAAAVHVDPDEEASRMMDDYDHEEVRQSAGYSEHNDADNNDEEAQITAMFRPSVEPVNPCTRAFWKRHFGTDSLVSAHLYVLSSIFYVTQTLLQLSTVASSSTTVDACRVPHAAANAFGAILFLVASKYFIKLSYPEVTMIMAYRAMTKDPTQMHFWERYVTANEVLVVLWIITGAVVVPNLVVALYEAAVLQEESQAWTDFLGALVTLPLLGILNVSAMPDAMRANNGRGSSFFFDGFWSPLLCLGKKDRKQLTSTGLLAKTFGK
eukprot:scaffold1992_cov187-Amphora_coffeaeformis.AAC.25